MSVEPPTRATLGWWALLALIAFSAAELRYVTLYVPENRRLTGQWLESSVDPEGYTDFLREVERRTPPGSRIALVIPRRWSNGYSYAYYRANYLIHGRDIVPVIWRDDRPIGENMRGADFVAAWKSEIRQGEHEPIWRGFAGTLYQRKGTPR